MQRDARFLGTNLVASGPFELEAVFAESGTVIKVSTLLLRVTVRHGQSLACSMFSTGA
jgi:hypothetical protein